MLESIISSDVLYSAVMFIIVLSVLVFVHELGHYLAAKSVGVRVRSFSIGFGKELFGYTRANGERWKFSLIPLGGYVDMYGMDQDEDYIQEEKDKEKLKDAFFMKNVWARIWVVFAGPLANFLFAIVALTALYSISGVKEPSTVIGKVMEGMPAEAAGIMPGDRITTVNNQDVNTWDELVSIISVLDPNKEIKITVDRNGENIELALFGEDKEVTNILEEKSKRTMIGVILSPEYVETKQVGFTEALTKGLDQTYQMSTLILKSVKRMITGEMKADVGGPLTIAEQSGKAAEGGMYALIMFMVMISVNLGILNLLPIPVLDGGHILYCLIEILTFGRGLHDTIKMIANYVGLALLLSLMVFAFYKDIDRLFF